MNVPLRSHALILNAAASNGAVVLLDEYRGRTDVRRSFYADGGRTAAQQPVTGYLIEWAGREYLNNTVMISSEFVAAPASWAHDDLLFVHHVCELCCAYLPPAQGAQDVYPLLSVLYKRCSPEKITLYKKVFLYNIISLLGLHPDESDVDLFLFPLISSVGDSMFDFQGIRCDDISEKKLTLCLCKTLHQLHERSPMKTFSFVKRLGVAL